MKQETKKEKIKSFGDFENNLILFVDNGTRIKVFLKLKNIPEKRYIATCVRSTSTIRMKRDRELHLLRKVNAYGFNYEFLFNTTFQTVQLADQFDNWKIPKEYILKNGSFLHFQKQGFERQIFLTLEQLEEFKKQEPL